MKIVIVSATFLEIQQSIFFFKMKEIRSGLWEYKSSELCLHILVTGIGIVNTAYQCGQYLAQYSPDFALHIGIAGSYNRSLELGGLVEIIEDSFADLGVQEENRFLTLDLIGFPLFSKGGKKIYNTLRNQVRPIFDIPQVSGITLSQVQASLRDIDQTELFWGKDVETMESAAFFRCAYSFDVAFRAIRSVSNYIEPRDLSKWQLAKAVCALQAFVIKMISRRDFFANL